MRNELNWCVTTNGQNLMLVVSRIREFLEQINRVSRLANGLYLLLMFYYYCCYYFYLLGVLCGNKASSFTRSATIPGEFLRKTCWNLRVRNNSRLEKTFIWGALQFLRKTCWNLRVRNNSRLEKRFIWGALQFLPITLLSLASQNEHVAWVGEMVK